jgi:hypothetical protein
MRASLVLEILGLRLFLNDSYGIRRRFASIGIRCSVGESLFDP